MGKGFLVAVARRPGRLRLGALALALVLQGTVIGLLLLPRTFAPPRPVDRIVELTLLDLRRERSPDRAREAERAGPKPPEHVPERLLAPPAVRPVGVQPPPTTAPATEGGADDRAALAGALQALGRRARCDGDLARLSERDRADCERQWVRRGQGGPTFAQPGVDPDWAAAAARQEERRRPSGFSGALNGCPIDEPGSNLGIGCPKPPPVTVGGRPPS